MERLPESCTEIEAALPLFAGGDLDAREMEAVRVHVEGCPRCQVRAERARTARERLATLRAEEPTVDLWPGIRAQLAAEGWLANEERTVAARPVGRAVAWRRGALAAAAAAALLAVSQLLAPPVADPGSGVGPVGPAHPAIAATPVSSPAAGRTLEGGLRRLSPEEGHLLQQAQPFAPEELFAPARSRGDANLASDLRRSGPVRLRRVR